MGDGRRDLVFRLLAPAAGLLLRVFLRVRVVGQDHVARHGPVLLAANHTSHLDPLVLAVVLHRLGRNVRFLAVSGLFEVPIVGRVLRMTGMIPVHRGAGVDSMVELAAPFLYSGDALLVYPEGTIPSYPGQRLAAKPGAGLLALRSGAPVVPVATWGLRRRRRPWRGRLPVGVVFGPTVDLTAWAGRTDNGAQAQSSARILEAVRELLPAAQGEAGPGRA